MQEVQIIRPKPENHTQTPKDEYVDVHGLLDYSMKLVSKEKALHDRPTNLLFNSAHGLGKTLLTATLRTQLSAALGIQVPMIVFDCSEDTREYHLKGTLQGIGDVTPFVLGPIPGAIDLANRVGACILSLEEVSALTPGSQKILNSITDWRSGVYLPQVSKHYGLEPGKKVIVVATMNPSAYGGVYTLNQDLRSRFCEFHIPFPTMKQEKKILTKICPGVEEGVIEKACQLAVDTRTRAFEYRVSTRDLKNLIDQISMFGGDPIVPLSCFANKFEGDEKNTAVDRIQGTFGVKIAA